MGLFGFGKKKDKKETEPAVEPVDEDKVAAEAANAAAKAESAETVLAEPSSEYVGRGEERGPWDVNDEEVPDYDDYLDLGAYYLPFMQNIELRIKANRATQQVLGSTITYGKSSLEIEAFAAPKTLGLWDDVRADLIEANKAASEVEGVFGTELKLPVNVKGGKTVNTRIVGVDGPRWMLRGIFSGVAATDPDSPETEALNKFFADIVVERGEEPLAPRDLIPMHPPVAPAERKAAAEAGEENGKEHFKDIPDNKPKGPLSNEGEDFSVIDAIGGPRGVIESMLPGVVFVVLFVVTSNLNLTIAVSAILAVLQVIARLIQRQSVMGAVSGLVAVGICLIWAWQTHEARNYYIFGFITNAGYAALLAVSLIARVPGLGLVIEFIRSLPTEHFKAWFNDWMSDKALKRAYMIITGLWVGLFLLRLAVQVPLYLTNHVAALGVARLLMGIPFWALAIWVSYLIIATPMHRHKAVATQNVTQSESGSAAEAVSEPVAGKTGKDSDAS